MHTDPTIVHSVADLRREALLTESATDRRTMPVRGRTTRSRTVIHGLVIGIAFGIRRIVDEFEPVPSPVDLTGRRPETPLRP